MDARKSIKENIGADKMLDNLRTDTKKNRNYAYEVLGRELNDKRERLQKIEILLQEPMTT